MYYILFVLHFLFRRQMVLFIFLACYGIFSRREFIWLCCLCVCVVYTVYFVSDNKTTFVLSEWYISFVVILIDCKRTTKRLSISQWQKKGILVRISSWNRSLALWQTEAGYKQPKQNRTKLLLKFIIALSLMVLFVKCV